VEPRATTCPHCSGVFEVGTPYHIEVKKPGEKMTQLQEATARRLADAGAVVFVADDVAVVEKMLAFDPAADVRSGHFILENGKIVRG
jgi:hypothetical protein